MNTIITTLLIKLTQEDNFINTIITGTFNE